MILVLSKGLNFNLLKDKRFNCLRIGVTNKYFFSNFSKDIKDLKITKQESLGIISGLIDAEGYVDIKRSTIEIANVDEVLLKKIQEYLFQYYIKSSLCKKTVLKKR